MKQLFIDILTKMTPHTISNRDIQYSIKDGERTIYIHIEWRYVNPTNAPELEFTLPFTELFTDYSFINSKEYTQKIYVLRINDCVYWMNFNPVEICEIDRIVYNIFPNYQTDKIKTIQNFLNVKVQPEPKSIKQKFEEAQEATINNE